MPFPTIPTKTVRAAKKRTQIKAVVRTATLESDGDSGPLPELVNSTDSEVVSQCVLRVSLFSIVLSNSLTTLCFWSAGRICRRGTCSH